MLGDFNARTGIKSGICLLIVPVPVHCFSLTSLTDLTIPDGEMLYQIGVSPESIYSLDTADQLKQFNLDTERVSMTKLVNLVEIL